MQTLLKLEKLIHACALEWIGALDVRGRANDAKEDSRNSVFTTVAQRQYYRL
jgi:hypothetical protein